MCIFLHVCVPVAYGGEEEGSELPLVVRGTGVVAVVQEEGLYGTPLVPALGEAVHARALVLGVKVLALELHQPRLCCLGRCA